MMEEIKTQLFCFTCRMTLEKLKEIFYRCFRIWLVAVGLVDTPYDAVYLISFHFYWKSFKNNQPTKQTSPTVKSPFVWKESWIK